jgi:hypothetical protein
MRRKPAGLVGSATRAPTFKISTQSWSMVRNTVAGNLQITGSAPTTTPAAATISSSTTTPASPTNFVCGTTINGNLQFDDNGTAVQIGSANPLICAGNTIGGLLEANNNTNTVFLFDNMVGGDMQVVNNTGALDVVGNNVSGNLQCQGNSMLIMGGMNTAKNTQGQCH